MLMSRRQSTLPRHGCCERLHLDARTPWWGEHRCRYRFAARYSRDARVLDIACGTGFGVSILADAGASHVIGVDVDSGAAAEAQAHHGGCRRSFLAGDGTLLPFSAASFDLVSSFETIEHVAASDAFLAEICRVLTPTGTLILSTPNRDYTVLNGQQCVNPFHVREYSRGELQDRLRRHFGTVALLGQRIACEYQVSPFESDHRRLQFDTAARLRLLWWKAQNKLPFPIKNRLSWFFSGHPFYPNEEHYCFSEEQIETAPVLVAVCHP
jgi:SAM-dependent methyltransferase